ncbi:MAG: DNA repair protein RadA [Firmicutes bacterium]|nr:DNA repair protein RadA [Bacillota bacterium]MBQ5436516.1 DNA repair protein RadA [Bacillota bacterium]MBQ6013857.1 DNA repair protein RadA [Bacillota bacterium]MBR0441429.1 DNA repair protein RadA [Bacillota bacterium]
MAKKNGKTVFVCQECGYESPRWMGQCICGAWNSFVEEKVYDETDDSRSRSGKGASRPSEGVKGRSKPQRLSSVTSGQSTRIDTGIGELNRVLGGGLVKGSLTLISGEPGIGKSTMIIQAASHICKALGTVLYVSGEESEEQIKMRADRVCKEGTGDLYVLSETSMEAVIAAVDQLDPKFLIIDSIQTMYTDEYDSAPGSVSQVRACGNLLMNLGKGRDIPVFIVAHVTKSGELAGPKIVEHMVDTVLQFSGERSQDLRILRALKNRFGTTSEIGAFEMREEGLVEIENLSASFLEGLEDSSAGAVATAVYEGTRPLLLEIQALTAPTNVGFARRTAIGVENSRLGMIVAVLERKASLSLINRDIYVNVVGGMRPEGTSIDLAVALAIWSDEKAAKLPSGFIAIGEIGLTGDLRPVRSADKLIREADRMGFKAMMLPRRSVEKLPEKPKNMRLIGVTSLAEAIKEAAKLAERI